VNVRVQKIGARRVNRPAPFELIAVYLEQPSPFFMLRRQGLDLAQAAPCYSESKYRVNAKKISLQSSSPVMVAREEKLIWH
jgi:hypothetical protein